MTGSPKRPRQGGRGKAFDPGNIYTDAVHRMLHSAAGGWVTMAYMETALRGLSAPPRALENALKRIARKGWIGPGEALENCRGYAYRIRASVRPVTCARSA